MKRFNDLAIERIYRIIEQAKKTAIYDLELANEQAKIAKRISMRYKVRLPYEIRQLFCKRCKRFIIPGINASIRIGRSNIKAIRIRCLECENIYRKIIK